MKKYFCFILSLFSVVCMAEDYDPSYKAWGQWLKNYAVVNGSATTVKYKEALKKKNDMDPLVQTIEKMERAKYDSLPEKERLAFLINSYNILTVKWILDHYPVKSIKDTGSFLQSPWKKKFFKLFGEDENLDGIEHEKIRKDFNEPRIHFAVVCASKGCPALKGVPYLASDLDKQLEESLKAFLQDGARNRYDTKENTLYLSKIFNWYGDDFKKASGTVQNFVAPRMGKTPEEVEKIKNAKVEFLEYDWDLNEAP